MDWDDLRYFIALARAGSLSAAARRVRAEHSTVARRVAGLEASLGLRLFDRLPRGYALTPEGEQVAALAERLEEDVLAIERLVHGREGSLSGSVRISAPPVFASHFLAPRLAPLRARHPGLLLELVGASQAVSLTRREADLAIRLARPEEGSLVARRLGEMAYGLYGAAEYVAARPPADRDYLGYDESLEHVPQQRWLLGLAKGRPLALRTNDLATLHAAARAGLGLAALPRFLGDADPALVRLPAGNAEAATRGIWLLVHADLRRSARIRAVMDHLAGIILAERRLLSGAATQPAGQGPDRAGPP